MNQIVQAPGRRSIVLALLALLLVCTMTFAVLRGSIGVPEVSPSQTTLGNSQREAPSAGSHLQRTSKRLHCAKAPSTCGYPDATNTGPSVGSWSSVPHDTVKGNGWHYDKRGWIAVDRDGAIVAALQTNVPIDVTASNVTIRDSMIRVDGNTWGISLRHANNVKIRNNTISNSGASAERLMVGIKDIYGDSSGVEILGNNISRTSTGIQVESGLLEDNYIHSLRYSRGDHLNGTTSNGGSTLLTIRHNTVLNHLGQTDAISLFQDFGRQANRIIEDNLLAGGGYTLYAGANPGKVLKATDILVINNRFSRLYFPRGGRWGPVAAWHRGGGNRWTGNVWDDTGSSVPEP